MNYFKHFRCTECGAVYDRDAVRYLCPACARDYKPGIPLPGVLETVLDCEAIGAQWKQAQAQNALDSEHQRMEWLLERFSAVELAHYPPLPVGKTPLFPVGHLAAVLDMAGLWVKYDGVNPSGSYKDRASQLVVAEANRLGIDRIVCASTGNAASSLACLCAASAKQAVIFAPAQAPVAKLVQIRIHGAELHKVEGTYDDAFAQALDYSATHDCLNRNTAYHPYTIEGKKTAGLEIYAQLGQVPDWIVVPVGDGVILAGIHKAFCDLKAAGITDRLPRLLSVQAASSDAVTSYWESGVYHDAEAPFTIADSISVKTPSNARWALRALIETNGMSLRVTDAEISRDQEELARLSGVFAEPSCSATLSGLKAALHKGWIKPSDSCVLLITGHGLKDIGAVRV